MGVLELPLADGPVIVGFAGNAGLCFGTEGSRYIGSGEAASYRRLPPLEPITALSWHVPLPVLRGPLSEPSVIDYRRLRTFCPLQSFRLPASSGWGRTKYLPHPCVLAWLGFRGQDVSGEIG